MVTKRMIKELAINRAIISEQIENDNPEIYIKRNGAIKLEKLLGEAIEELKAVLNTMDDGK